MAFLPTHIMVSGHIPELLAHCHTYRGCLCYRNTAGATLSSENVRCSSIWIRATFDGCWFLFLWEVVFRVTVYPWLMTKRIRRCSLNSHRNLQQTLKQVTAQHNYELHTWVLKWIPTPNHKTFITNKIMEAADRYLTSRNWEWLNEEWFYWNVKL